MKIEPEVQKFVAYEPDTYKRHIVIRFLSRTNDIIEGEVISFIYDYYE